MVLVSELKCLRGEGGPISNFDGPTLVDVCKIVVTRISKCISCVNLAFRAPALRNNIFLDEISHKSLISDLIINL